MRNKGLSIHSAEGALVHSDLMIAPIHRLCFPHPPQKISQLKEKNLIFFLLEQIPLSGFFPYQRRFTTRMEVFMLTTFPCCSPCNKAETWKVRSAPVSPLEPGDAHPLRSLIFQVLAFYCGYMYHIYQWLRWKPVSSCNYRSKSWWSWEYYDGAGATWKTHVFATERLNGSSPLLHTASLAYSVLSNDIELGFALVQRGLWTVSLGDAGIQAWGWPSLTESLVYVVTGTVEDAVSEPVQHLVNMYLVSKGC